MTHRINIVVNGRFSMEVEDETFCHRYDKFKETLLILLDNTKPKITEEKENETS